MLNIVYIPETTGDSWEQISIATLKVDHREIDHEANADAILAWLGGGVSAGTIEIIERRLGIDEIRFTRESRMAVRAQERRRGIDIEPPF